MATVEEAITGLAAENDSPTLLGENTAFTATVTAGTNLVYAWEFGDGSTAQGQFASHAYTETGVYTATVTASNPVSSEQANTLVEVVPLPPTWRFWLPVVRKY